MPVSHASISDWQKGASIEPRWNTDFGSTSFEQSVDNLAAANANYVSLIIPYYQSNIYSTDIAPGWNTPTDDSLISGIKYIHSKGMQVMLVLHLESYDGQWRAQINPAGRDVWYANYLNVLNHLATIGQAQGVESICIGTELIDMASNYQNSDNVTRWQNIISQVRNIYKGKLTYGANWGDGGWFDEADNILFWDRLDYIGISAYFNLNSSGDVASLEGQWDYWNGREIQPLNARWGKPVLFTEIGYKSITGSHYQPWNYNWSGAIDQDEQARDYTALFDYWSRQPFMAGVQLWDWSSDPNAGGWDGDYTPQNKKAQDVMTQWFSSSSPTTTPATTTNAQFTSSGTTNNPSPTVNQPLTLNGTVTDTGSAVSGTTVDMEVYSDNNGGLGQKVFQQYFQNQSFNQGQSQSYSASWTPNASGTYHLAIGVFNADWTVNYNWNPNAVTFFVGQAQSTPSPTPTPTPTSTPSPSPSPTPVPAGNPIDVWWPTDGGTITGVQPFKAMLQGFDISQYNMFWQVDSGQLNSMGNNNTDWPHKEAAVDVSGWNWSANNHYLVNFVAQDFNGNMISQHSIGINVSH